jgi:hypothetical protein
MSYYRITMIIKKVIIIMIEDIEASVARIKIEEKILKITIRILTNTTQKLKMMMI